MRMQRTYIALTLAGALTAATATPSLADSRWGWAAGGFAAGALVGAAAANANAGYYYGPGYAYAPAPSYYYSSPGYTSYGYAPGHAAYGYAPGYTTGYTAYSYAPSYYSYRPNRAPVFDPENGDDPDPRIGGSYKMNSSGSE